MWDLRTRCLCLIFVCFVPSLVQASVPVRLVAPKLDTGSQILRQFLLDRGFLLEPSAPSQAVLTITIKGDRQVRMDYRRQRRSFRLPAQIQSARTRAHAIISMAEVFLEEAKAMPSSAPRAAQQVSHRASQSPPQRVRAPGAGVREPKPGPGKRQAQPERRTKNTDLTRHPKAPRRKRAKSASTARVGQKKRQPPPRATAPVRLLANAQTTVPPRQATPMPTRRLKAPSAKTSPAARTAPELAQSQPGARQTPAARPGARSSQARVIVRRKAGLVATAGLRHKSPPTPARHRNWHVEFGGAFKFRWADNPGESWGGAVTAGLLVWDFTLQLELSLLSFWLKKQETTIPIFRSKLLGGWRLPLRRWTDRLELYILGGVVLDPYIIEQTNASRAVLHLGLALDVQVQFRIVSNMYVFFRYGLSLMFLGYEPDPEGLDIRAYPAPFQQSTIVGLQFRL